MQLRSLEMKDALLMLEWMHDPDVVGHLSAKFMEKTLEDCKHFIACCNTGTADLHLAVVNDQDEYMGTVSLKHMDSEYAEFAITVRAVAMGQGFSKYAMDQILHQGVERLHLKAIYWCVSPNNERAIRFYDKNGYQRTNQVPERFLKNYHQELYWYVFQQG